MESGSTAGDTFEGDDVVNIYWEVEILPGGSISDTFTAPTEPGEYQVVFRTPGHIEAGMMSLYALGCYEEGPDLAALKGLHNRVTKIIVLLPCQY